MYSLFDHILTETTSNKKKRNWTLN